MTLLIAITCAGLWLTLIAPPRPVARLSTITRARERLPHRSPDVLALGTARTTSPPNGKKRRITSSSFAAAPHHEVDLAVLLDLLAAALKNGSAIPDALTAVGSAASGQRGAALSRVAAHLTLGATWEGAWAEISKELGLDPLAGALAPARINGAPVAALLQHAQRRIRQTRTAKDRVAAKQLGVRLILPVTVCYLPAFVAIGLLPVVLVLVQQGAAFL